LPIKSTGLKTPGKTDKYITKARIDLRSRVCNANICQRRDAAAAAALIYCFKRKLLIFYIAIICSLECGCRSLARLLHLIYIGFLFRSNVLI
jgi:hypothetical protein